MSIPRGIRNNNPGNIRHGSPWLGLSDDQPDPAFCTFNSPEYGIRAIAVILGNYRRKYGMTTIRQMIDRWAPPTENDTDAYVQHVADRCGLGPDDTISDLNKIMPVLVASIIRHENGQHPYSPETIAKGIAMAGGSLGVKG